MRGTIWLLLFLAKRSDLFVRGKIRRFLLSGGWGWKDLIKWLVMEKILGRGYSFVKTFLRMRVIDVPNEVVISNFSVEPTASSDKFYFVDRDIKKETIFKNFSTPKTAKYKIVSFYSEGVPFIEVLIIALLRRWKLANLDEALSVANSCDLRAIGLGDSHSLIALGTIIRRSSAIFSFCCPIIAVRLVEKEITQNEKRVSLYLHDILNNCPTGQHILFRVS